MLSRWKEDFEKLMNEEHEQETQANGGQIVDQEVRKIRKEEVRSAFKRMKSSG